MSRTLERLQALSEQLDPLETAYADVRFLEVDYEQIEKQYEEMLKEMRNEIDSENLLKDEISQLEAEVAKLQNAPSSQSMEELQKYQLDVLPKLCARQERLSLKGSDAEAKRRVVRSKMNTVMIKNNLDELVGQVADSIVALKTQEQERIVEEIRISIEHLLKNPTDEAIQSVQESLLTLKFSDPRLDELRKQLTEIKDERNRREAARQQLKTEVEIVWQKLELVSEKFPSAPKPVSEDPSAKRKKSKVKKREAEGELRTSAPSTANRNDQIFELKKAVGEIKNELLPLLDKQISNEDDPALVQPFEERRNKAEEMRAYLLVSDKIMVKQLPFVLG